MKLARGGSTLSRNREFQREFLLLQDRPYTDPVTYDAQDGVPNVLIGSESSTPVSDEFSGPDWVQIDLGGDTEDADHLISPQEHLQIAMAR
jgi:hypothetical protein